jgi:probable rRNA maturation factor
MKRVILSTRYELSLAFVSTPAMKRLNRAHRGHDRSTDILSFSIAPDMGELIVSSADVAKRAPAFGMAPRAYLAYLFIHGCLHLMGHDHGPRMDREEQRRCKQLNTPHPSQKRVIG